MDRAKTQGFDISGASATVIGCGALGCNAAVHLAGAGIGKLFLCDFDMINESNLNRQFLYTPQDIGLKKTETAEKRLKAYNPGCDIEITDKHIKCTADLLPFKDSDIIISAIDNAETRAVIAKFCEEYERPLVNGGLNGFFGVCYLYVPGLTPCLGCAGMTDENSKKLKCPSSTAGIIGSLSASLAERYLSGDAEEFAGRLYVYDNEEIHSIKLKKRDGCGCL